jgi:multidrug efflux pump subunit AcrB
MLLLGAYSYYGSPRQENPEINAPVAMVTVLYPGASPEDVASLVTSKIEDELAEIPGYDYAHTYSRNSVSVNIVRLVYGTDTEKAWLDLRQKMEDVQDALPEECAAIEVNTDLVETAGVIISMSGEVYTYEELSDYAEALRNDLSEISGISRFEINGKQEKNIVVEIDFKALNQLDLSLDEIVLLLKGQNIEIPSGSLDTDGVKINVKAKGTFQSVEEIKNVIVGISSENGSVLKLSDIAYVHFDFVESPYNIKEGKNNAVLLTGYFQKNRNIVFIGNDVSAAVESFKSRLPEDIVFEQVLYQPETVEKSVRSFALNLLQGILFVIFVIFIGMGLRNAIIVSTAIPASIFITFIFMRLFGINIHQISIAALIVSLGMLVDNAIVISDSIQVLIDKGEDQMKACVDGAKSVAIPVLTSTLTTIAAYMPFLFLNSIAGEYIKSLPKIVMLSLTASYIVALFVTPSMAYIFFKPSKVKTHVSRTARIFEKALDRGIKHRSAVIAMICLALAITGFIGFRLGLQFFPYADTDMIYLNVKSHSSGNMNQTEAIVNQMADMLEEEPVVRAYTSSIGGGLPKFFNTIKNPSPSQDVAQMMLRLDLDQFGKGEDFEKIPDFISYLQRKADSAISKGKITVRQLEQAEPIDAAITVRLTGNDMDQLNESAEQIKALLSSIDGTMNVDDDFEDRIYQFVVNPNTVKTSLFGVSNFNLQNEISIALRGREASTFHRDGNEYALLVKSDIASKSDLENFMVKSNITGNKVLLKEIAEIGLESQLPVIKKYNGKLAVHVLSNVADGYSSASIQDQLINRLESLDLHGVAYEFNGETEKIKENFGNIAVAGIFALIAVYLILLIQFKSFVQPLIILATVPLAVVGSVLGLYIFGQKLSFMAMLGAVSLLGIVVNNAIILIDFINAELKEGKSVRQSCTDAVNKRMRPIMLSTNTTIIGLTPLVYSGSALFTPMAIALMSGLLVSMALTLVVIPVIYSIVMERIHPSQPSDE